MQVPVYNMQGKEVASLSIDEKTLGGQVNADLIKQAYVKYHAATRQGSSKTKNRRETEGSTRKLYKQKGTGNARAGARRSGTRRGGGHIFAKRPRDFGWRMPRKALQQAARMALASRIADDEVKLIDSLAVSEPKTAVVAGMLKKLGLGEKTVLFAPEKHDAAFWKSARNIDGVSVSPVAELNAWSILRPRSILMTRAAIDAFRASAVEANKPAAAAGKKKPAKKPAARAAKKEAK